MEDYDYEGLLKSIDAVKYDKWDKGFSTNIAFESGDSTTLISGMIFPDSIGHKIRIKYSSHYDTLFDVELKRTYQVFNCQPKLGLSGE